MERKKNEVDESAPERKPYEAPQVLYREPLEAVATACTPSPPAKGSFVVCPTGPLSS